MHSPDLASGAASKANPGDQPLPNAASSQLCLLQLLPAARPEKEQLLLRLLLLQQLLLRLLLLLVVLVEDGANYNTCICD